LGFWQAYDLDTMRIPPVVAFLMVLASQPAFAQRPKSAAVAVDVQGFDAKTTEHLTGSVSLRVVDGFAAAKVALVPISNSKLTALVGECVEASCLQEVAKSELLDLVVQVKVQAKKSGKKNRADYDISMMVVRVVPDVFSWREKIGCPGCAASEATNMVSQLATIIGGRIAKETPQEATRPALPPTAAEAPDVPPPRPTIIKSSPTAQEKSRLWPWLTVGAGGVLAVTSVVLWTQEGKGHGCVAVAGGEPCREKTVAWPAATVTGGLGLAGLVAGVIWIVGSGTEEQPTRVGLSPRGVVMEGRF
jgi:hypothetical protein